MADPASNLQSAENALRLAIRAVYGDAWMNRMPAVGQMRRRQQAEAERRHGTLPPGDLLTFAELGELSRFVLTNWSDFEQVFHDEARTRVWLETLESVRNPTAHSRPLVDHERLLLEGISWQIRNQVTIFRMGQMPASKHYAVIESVIDSYGITGAPNSADSGINVVTGIRIEVGDSVTFRCTGSDPRGRELHWILVDAASTLVYDMQDIFDRDRYCDPRFLERLFSQVPQAHGDDVSLTWTATEDHVSEDTEIYIYMQPVGARFLRRNAGSGLDMWLPSYVPCDDVARFHYAVNPPLE